MNESSSCLYVLYLEYVLCIYLVLMIYDNSIINLNLFLIEAIFSFSKKLPKNTKCFELSSSAAAFTLISDFRLYIEQTRHRAADRDESACGKVNFFTKLLPRLRLKEVTTVSYVGRPR